MEQGAIDNAKTYLDYCTIVSPRNGCTGIRLVDQGNFVRASDATGILVITRLQPITALVTLLQPQLLQVRDAFGNGRNGALDRLSATSAARSFHL